MNSSKAVRDDVWVWSGVRYTWPRREWSVWVGRFWAGMIPGGNSADRVCRSFTPARRVSAQASCHMASRTTQFTPSNPTVSRGSAESNDQSGGNTEVLQPEPVQTGGEESYTQEPELRNSRRYLPPYMHIVSSINVSSFIISEACIPCRKSVFY